MDQINPQGPTAAEIEATQRQERAQIRSDAELLTDLLKHRGWPRYMALVERVAQNYHQAIMKPLESSLEVTKTEFAKGALSGLSLCTALPGMKINEAKELRAKHAEEDEE